MFSIQAFLLFLYPKKIFPRPRLRRHFPVLFFREVSFCSRMDIQLNKHYLLKQFLSPKWHATCHKLSVYLCAGQFLGLLFSFLTSLLVLMLLYTILIILGLNMQQNNFCHLFFQDVLANLNPLYFHTDFTVRICPFPPTPLHLRNNNKRQPIGILMRNQYLYNIEFPNPQTGLRCGCGQPLCKFNTFADGEGHGNPLILCFSSCPYDLDFRITFSVSVLDTTLPDSSILTS